MSFSFWHLLAKHLSFSISLGIWVNPLALLLVCTHDACCVCVGRKIRKCEITNSVCQIEAASAATKRCVKEELPGNLRTLVNKKVKGKAVLSCAPVAMEKCPLQIGRENCSSQPK